MTRLRTAILGLALTLGLSLGYGSVQAEERDRTNDSQPTITLSAPATGSAKLYPAAFDLEAAVSFPGKAGDRNDRREGVEIEFLANGQKFAEAERAPYRASYTPPQAGIYTLSARIRYGEGKRSIQSNSVEIVFALPPTVSFSTPADNTVQTAPANFTLSAAAAAPIGSIAKVEFYAGATLIGTATAAPYTANWSNVPAGNYTLTARATDNYGFSTTSIPVTVISNAPPTVSLTSPAPNTVSIAPGSFTLTANAADADGSIAKVDFYNGATLLGTATAAPYSYTWANVPSGNYTITAVATDGHGATTTSVPIVVVSNQSPTVGLMTPAANANYTAPSAITLNASASDADGTIAKVDFYDGTTLLGTATAAPYTFTWNNIATGSHILTVVATDNLGAATTSAATTVTVIAPPVVSLTGPANNAVLTAPATFTLTADATSAGSIAKVDFYSGATLLGTATTAPYSYTWTNVPAGSYTLTAVATDNAGAQTTSAAVMVTSNQLPTVSLTSPAANAVSVAPGSFTLTADATDADGSIAKVDFYENGTLLGTSTTAPYSYTWTNVPAGPHSLTAIATDNLGAQTTSAAVSVISDAPPTISLTSPTHNAVSVAPGSFTLTADAASTTSTIAKVDYYASSAGTSTLIGTATTAPYSFDWTNIPAGAYSLTAVATDALGITTTSMAVTVTSDQAPTVTLTGPAAGSQITSPNSITLTATADSVTSTIAKVEFYNGATLLGTATTAPYSYTWINVPVGSYDLTAKAIDALGIATTSATITVTAIANVPPAVSLTGPANGTTMKVPGSFTLTADAASTTSSIAKVDFYAIDNATNASTLIGTATQAPYTTNWSNVPLGDYILSAVATDTLGAVTTSSQVSVTVNTGIAQAYYIHADHLDTPRTITDTAGNVVWQWDNTDPFGNNVPNENPSGLGRFEFNKRYSGQYFDKETGLHYNFYRDGYNPEIGAYTQSDPIGLEGGINTYTYVHGNTLNK